MVRSANLGLIIGKSGAPGAQLIVISALFCRVSNRDRIFSNYRGKRLGIPNGAPGGDCELAVEETSCWLDHRGRSDDRWKNRIDGFNGTVDHIACVGIKSRITSNITRGSRYY